MWHAYQIPIVYTYTEMSQGMGKYMLQTSIASVRMHMPENKIHVIYHGNSDHDFLAWLKKGNVIVHEHHPTWKADIERMRLNGDPAKSHLYLHEGNYFGTWQRIDIPTMLDTEYCILLDADTVILRPFTLADFGLNTTYSIAMSAESNQRHTEPWNARSAVDECAFPEGNLR